MDVLRAESRKSSINEPLRKLLLYLKANARESYALKIYLHKMISKKSFKTTLIDLGILVSADFFIELQKRISFKLLPFQPSENSLEYILTNVFYRKKDVEFIKQVDKATLEELLRHLNFSPLRHGEKKNEAYSEFLFSINVLSMRICGLAMESEVMKMAPQYENFDSPFIALQKEIADFTNKIDNQLCRPDEEDLQYKQILVFIDQCEDFIQETYKNTDKFGITLRVNQNLIRIRQQLERLETLLATLVADQERSRMQASIDLWLLLIKLNCAKNDLKTLIYESTKTIAYEITQFTGKTGEHYITFTSKAYWKMLCTAMGGGAIVGIFCLSKALLSSFESLAQSSFFIQALVYGLNYASAFILIYLCKFTLATKQPAMTASTFAQTLSKDIKEIHSKKTYENLAKLFSALIRSQFIAFVGNVLIAIPMVYFTLIFIQSGPFIAPLTANAQYLREGLHPYTSYSFVYAAIAGFYLFLSGIIAGNSQNRLKYYKVPERIRQHPLLISSIGQKWTQRLANFHQNNSAGIISNFWFGIFLGSTGPLGNLLGLDLDIRHIAFSAGNLALILYEFGAQMSSGEIISLSFSVAVIGAINFSVSFALTLIVALRSRGVALTELSLIFVSLLKRFLQTPLQFFLPVSLDAQDDESDPQGRAFDQRRRAV